MKTTSEFQINIEIERGVHSNDWLKVATRRARTQAEQIGVEWTAATVFVKLPEAGRCMVKRAGDQGFTAYG